MSELSRVAEPVLGPRARIAGVVLGLATLVAGGVAVFRTDNELGSTALVAAGVAMAGLAVFGNRLEAVVAVGVRLELKRQARRARELAERARADGDVDRAEDLERRAQRLLAAADATGSRYERLRSSEPSGWERTSRMEGVLREARALDAQALSAQDVAGIFATGTEGSRIVALALIEDSPRLATTHVLVDAIIDSRSTFEQYHGLVAAEQAVDVLSPEDRRTVREAVESVLARGLGDKPSDRRTVARRLLERLSS